jgi:hypothetical protein
VPFEHLSSMQTEHNFGFLLCQAGVKLPSKIFTPLEDPVLRIFLFDWIPDLQEGPQRQQFLGGLCTRLISSVGGSSL